MSFEDEVSNVEMAIDMIWNTKLEMAQELVCGCTDPLHSLYYSEISFLNAILTENKNDAKECFKRIETASKQATKVFGASPKSLEPSLSCLSPLLILLTPLNYRS